MKTAARNPSFRALSGFSLVELLVVVGVLLLLITMMVPAIGGMTRAMALSNGGSVLFEELTQAKVLAASLNRPVEVRLYMSGSVAADRRDSVRLYVPSEDASTLVPHSRRRYFSESVGIHPNTDFSSLLHLANGPLTGENNEQYYSFRFLPNGTLDLVSSSLPTLTVGFRTDFESESVPTNFVTVQVNPHTSHLQVFRP